MPFSLSLQFSPTFTPSSSSPNSQLARPPLPLHSSLRRAVSTRVVCISTRPKRNSGAKTHRSEAEELVRDVIRKFSDKEPLLKTLDKYVCVMRTERCFLLFEELGKRDKWLQCLEVFRWMQKQRWYIADNMEPHEEERKEGKNEFGENVEGSFNEGQSRHFIPSKSQNLAFLKVVPNLFIHPSFVPFFAIFRGN